MEENVPKAGKKSEAFIAIGMLSFTTAAKYKAVAVAFTNRSTTFCNAIRASIFIQHVLFPC